MKHIFTLTPLLVFPVIVYNLIAFMAPAANAENLMPIEGVLRTVLFQWGMISGGLWRFHLADLVLFLALVTLFFELVKATNTSGASLANHGFSIGLLMVCLVEFLLFQKFATSLFFLLTLATLLDVIAGFMITVTAARRDIGFGDGIIR